MNNRHFKPIVQLGLFVVGLFFLVACSENGSSDSSVNGGSSGQGGSTARFTIQNDHLIVVEASSIVVYSLQTPNDPLEVYRTYTSDGELETIFPYQENLLFIGSQNGSIILELSESGELIEIASISHARSCDPVVANDTQMFVTIRTGSGCWGSTVSNRLMAYDISDLTNPIRIANIVIDQPIGLGLQGTSLFVCYSDGLIEYDVTESVPEQINDYIGVSCNDLIPDGESLVLTSNRSINQVIADSGILTELSEISAGD